MRKSLLILLVFGAKLALCQLTPKVIQYEGTQYGCFTPEQGVIIYNSVVKANGYDSILLHLDLMEDQIRTAQVDYEKLYSECNSNYEKYDKIMVLDKQTIDLKDKEAESLRKHLRKRNLIDIGLIVLIVISIL